MSCHCFDLSVVGGSSREPLYNSRLRGSWYDGLSSLSSLLFNVAYVSQFNKFLLSLWAVFEMDPGNGCTIQLVNFSKLSPCSLVITYALDEACADVRR